MAPRRPPVKRRMTTVHHNILFLLILSQWPRLPAPNRIGIRNSRKRPPALHHFLKPRRQPISPLSPSPPTRSPVRLEPGDVVLVRSASGLGRIIRWAQRGPGERPSWANHVGLITGTGDRRTALITEALWRVRESSLDRKADAIQVWRHRDWHPAHRQAAAGAMRSFIGLRYGWWKLPVHLADALLARLRGLAGGRGEIPLVRRLLFVDSRPICSQVVGRAVLAAAGLKFNGLPPRQVTPDDIHDHLTADRNWELVLADPPEA